MMKKLAAVVFAALNILASAPAFALNRAIELPKTAILTAGASSQAKPQVRLATGLERMAVQAGADLKTIVAPAASPADVRAAGQRLFEGSDSAGSAVSAVEAIADYPAYLAEGSAKPEPRQDHHIPNPSVIDDSPRGQRSLDVYSKLYDENIVYLGTPIDDTVANLIIAQILVLAQKDPEKAIQLYINSPGGSITAGLGIYDTMQYVKNKIITICVGQAASMAALLLAAGDHRIALPNARILIHQPSMGGLSGQATDIDIHAKEILRMREITSHILAQHTGQKLDKVEKDVERDFIMSGQQALEYGIVDEISKPRQDNPEKKGNFRKLPQ